MMYIGFTDYGVDFQGLLGYLLENLVDKEIMVHNDSNENLLESTYSPSKKNYLVFVNG